MANTTNFNWETPDDTDLVKDGAAAIRTLGSAIDTSLVDLKGGTTGQILSKATGTDMDFTWITNDVGDITAVSAGTGISGGGTSGAITITNDMATTITASGDIVVGTGSGTYDNLPIGTTGQILTADTTVSPYKVKWATPAASASGLNLIATDSFSAVSSITKDSLFSTDYDNYRILIELTASATASFNLYLRSGGSNITSGYSRQTFSADDTSLLGARTTNTSEATVANSLSTGRNYVILDIASPFLTQDKAIISQALNTFNTVISQDYKNVLSTASSCTGIYFFPNTGNITGKVSYYGYGK